MSAISDSDRTAAFRAEIDDAPSLSARATAMVAFCGYLDSANRSAEALEVARDAAVVADEAGDDRLIGWAAFRQMMALRNLGRLDEVVAMGEQTREQFKSSGDVIGEVRAAALLAVVLLAVGEYDRGLQALVESSALISLISVPDVELVNALHLQALAFQQLSAFEPAVKASEEGLWFADKLEDPFEASWARFHLADHLIVWADFLSQRDPPRAKDLRLRAIDLLDQSLALVPSGTDEGFLGLLEMTRGLALPGVGRLAEGIACLSKAATTPGFEQGAAERARLDRALGRGFLETGDLDAAREHLDASIAALYETDLFGLLSSTLKDRADVRRRQGDLAGGVTDLQEALLTGEDRRLSEAVGRAKGILGRLDLEVKKVEITRREMNVEILERMAMVDPLTGISNRRSLDGFGTKAAVSTCEWLSVAVVDVDEFKVINDAFGHLVGDAVLQRIARVLEQSVRSGVDLAARYAGDEFVLVLVGLDEAAATEVCDRIRLTIAEYAWTDVKAELAVTVSIGIATEPVPATFWNLFADADGALFQAKTNGRNRSGVFTRPG